MKPNLIFFGGLVLLMFLVASLRTISTEREDSLKLKGTVTKTWYDQNNHDLSIFIAGDKRRFYVNRALEKGIRPLELQKAIEKQTIEFYYADHWTPLDPFSSIRHITQLSLSDSLIFSEFEDRAKSR